MSEDKISHADMIAFVEYFEPFLAEAEKNGDEIYLNETIRDPKSTEHKSLASGNDRSQPDEQPPRAGPSLGEADINSLKCPHCVMTYQKRSRYYYNDHVESHGKPLKCKYCKKRFTLESELLEHLNVCEKKG